jgi:ribonucleoside-diphosphate reductase alpha chain
MLLDYQDYPVKAAEISTKNRRSLGIGVTNYAYYLAKNGVKYSDGSANELTHKTFEALQYYSLKASVKLAKEFGQCPAYNETKYAKGILPIQTYKKDVDKFAQFKLDLDWGELSTAIEKHGLRNSTVTALMPCESSSQVSNSTNGIEPPRGYVSVKQSKDGILKQIVPEFEKLKDNYELLWNIRGNEGYLQLVAIMQKFVDQAISANTHYDPSDYLGNKVPMKVFLMDLLNAYKYGGKTLYYHNTRDGGGEDMMVKESSGCDSGACAI